MINKKGNPLNWLPFLFIAIQEIKVLDEYILHNRE